MKIPYEYITVVGPFLGTIGALGISRFGGRLGLMNHPKWKSSHVRVTPKGGGLGILAAFCAVSIWTGLPVWFWLATLILSGIAGLSGVTAFGLLAVSGAAWRV